MKKEIKIRQKTPQSGGHFMKLACRVDAGPQMGTGHLMRCLALAQEWQDRGGEALFITHDPAGHFRDRILKEGFRVHLLEFPLQAGELERVLAAETPDWVVLDGYHFPTALHQAIKALGPRLLVLDDYAHLPRYHADIILNQNYGAEQFSYQLEPGCRLLLGTKFTLLRREFRQSVPQNRKFPSQTRNLLVTLGGADRDNHTLKLLRGLNQIAPRLSLKIVLGPSNPHIETIAREAKNSRHQVEILRGVENMAPLMAWADLAVSAGGSTIWEMAFMGLPALFCVVADNQENAVQALARRGYPVIFDLQAVSEEQIGMMINNLASNCEQRREISRTGKAIVDGSGATRVIRAMTAIPVRVLFLGGNLSPVLAAWLQEQGEEVLYTEEKIDPVFVRQYAPDIIVSYNYRHILKKDVLSIPPRGTINLHSSYLPWNKGAHPNVWSFIEDTPKGVTIHFIDEGVDTGDILLQKKLVFDERRETLKSSYEKLHQEMQQLFKDNWEALKSGKIKPQPQTASGTLHYSRESEQFAPIIQEQGWETPIAAFKKVFKSIHISQD